MPPQKQHHKAVDQEQQHTEPGFITDITVSTQKPTMFPQEQGWEQKCIRWPFVKRKSFLTGNNKDRKHSPILLKKLCNMFHNAFLIRLWSYWAFSLPVPELQANVTWLCHFPSSQCQIPMVDICLTWCISELLVVSLSILAPTPRPRRPSVVFFSPLIFGTISCPPLSVCTIISFIVWFGQTWEFVFWLFCNLVLLHDDVHPSLPIIAAFLCVSSSDRVDTGLGIEHTFLMAIKQWFPWIGLTICDKMVHAAAANVGITRPRFPIHLILDKIPHKTVDSSMTQKKDRTLDMLFLHTRCNTPAIW